MSRQLVVDDFQATRAQDRVALVRLLEDDVEWRPPQSAAMGGHPFVGRDGVLGAMQREGARFFDLTTGRSEVGEIVADGDTVVVRSRYSCAMQGARGSSTDDGGVFAGAGDRMVRMDEHTDALRFSRVAMEPSA